MRRALLFYGAILLGLVAEAILWSASDLYLYPTEDSWFSAGLFTRSADLGLVVQGAVAAIGAALCLGRALVPLTRAPTRSTTTVSGPAPGGLRAGPVLPICGLLFLLAAPGPFGQARLDSEKLEVMDSMPGARENDLVADFRRHERTERTFGVLWLVVGGALLGTPLFLKPRVWQVARRMNGAGCALAVGGLLLSGFSVLVWFVNGLAMEGANRDVSRVGHLGVLAGAIVAVVGSTVAVVGGSSRPPAGQGDAGQDRPADRGRDSDVP
jgi:hypothetical protein